MDTELMRQKLGLLTADGYSLEDLNSIISVEKHGSNALVKIYKAAFNMDIREDISRQTQIIAVDCGFDKAEIEYVEQEPRFISRVGKVIAVMSGKGGVGKSMVASLTAVALSRAGYRVGILDADITGPSIPKVFGINGRPQGNELGFLPLSSRTGIRIVSINLLLEDDNNAVIWRGGMISKAISQFWTDVLWGNLDYLVVDLPPGTSDAPLTVMQMLPVSGVIMVSTPQGLTTMIVKKALNMVEKIGKKVVGLVENMSYIALPDGRKLRPFGESQVEELRSMSGAPLLAVFPIDSEITVFADSGNIENYISNEFKAYSEALLSAVSQLPINEPEKALEVCDNSEAQEQGGCDSKSCQSCSSEKKAKHHN